MDYKKFKRIRIITTSFISAMVAVAVVYNNMILALAGVLIGLSFLFLVKRRVKTVMVDERIEAIVGRASRFSYSVLTVTMAILSLVLVTGGRRMNEPDYETIGVILSYVALLSLALYSFSYKYFSKKYGEEDKKQD